MANIIIKDGGAASRNLRATGDGSAGSPFSPHHIIGDGAGNALGVASASPLHVQAVITSGGGSACTILWDGVDQAAIDSASRLLTVASAVINNQVSASISNVVATTVANQVSASISNVVTTQASLLNVAIDSASRILAAASVVIPGVVSASISNTVATTVGNQVSASISNVVGTTVANQVSASISNILSASVIQSTPNSIGNAWPMRLTDGTDTAAIDSASRQLVAASAEVTNTVSASISNTVATTVGNQVSASISNVVGTTVANQVSASISNAVTVAQGASGAAPWGVRLLDAAGNAYGTSAASPIFITGGAAGGTSATDRAAFAEGTTTYTPAGGLYQPSPQALTASQAGAVRMTAYRGMHTRLSDDSGNILGVSGSPLVVTGISGGAGGSSIVLTDGVDNVAVDSASRLTVVASVVVPDRISASISNVVSVQASLLNVAVDSASRLLASASVVIPGTVSASISNTVATTVGNQVSASISNTLSASVIQGTPNSIANAWPVELTDGVDSVAIDSASRLLTVASAVVTNTVSASISNVVTTQASLLNVAIDSASRLLTAASVVIPGTVSASISNTVATTVGNQVSASISNVVGTTVANQVSASISNTVNVAQSSTPWVVRITDATGNALGVAAGSPLFVNDVSGGGGGGAACTILWDGVDQAAIDSASRLLTVASAVVTNTVSASISNTVATTVGNQVSASISNVVTTQASLLNVAIDSASRLLTAASVVIPGTVSASISNVVATTVGNQVSASISNTLSASVIQSTPNSIANAWPVELTDGTDSVSIDSASRLLTIASAVITAQVSASISNTLTASVIQSTGAAITAPWSMRLSDGTDSAAVTSASGQHVNLRTNTGNEIGVSGSPLAIACDNGVVWYSGSLFSVSALGFSGSVAGSAVVLAGVAGSQIRVLAMTFTTSSSQFVGWQSGSSGTAASVIPAMGFGNFGGMDVNRMPHGYLTQTGNGSALVISQTTACYVRGSIAYIVVPN